MATILAHVQLFALSIKFEEWPSATGAGAPDGGAGGGGAPDGGAGGAGAPDGGAGGVPEPPDAPSWTRRCNACGETAYLRQGVCWNEWCEPCLPLVLFQYITCILL